MTNLNKLKSISNVRTFKENEYIFHEGDTGNDMYILLSGRVSIFIKSKDNLQIKLCDIGAGGFFGEMSLLEGEPRTATALAVENTVALSVNKDNFEAFIVEQPSMAFKLLKGLSSRIRALDEELSCLKKGSQYVIPPADSADALSDSTPCISAANPEDLKGVLYHDEHGAYEGESPDTDIFYIYDKKTTCPICGKEFELPVTSQSKLRPNSIDFDFRHRYEGFEPLWYNILVCPFCYFAGYSHEFDKHMDNLCKTFTEKTAPIRKKLAFKYSQPRKLDEVFTAYYLALHSAKALNAGPLKSARIWLQLSWLYKDAGDEKMYAIATDQAFEYYYDVLYGSSLTRLTDEQDQQCCLILGELYLLKNDRNQAVKLFHSAIRRGGGNALYNKQAQDRIYYVKHEMK